MLLLGSAALLIIVPLIASPEEATAPPLESRLRACAAIADSLQRLTCFDRLVEDLALPQASISEEDSQIVPTGWLIEKTANPLDDTPRVVARLQASEGQGRLGGGGPVELYVRCQSGKIEVFIWWREWFGTAAVGGGSIDVTTRFDQEDPVTRKWLKSTDGQMTFVGASSEGFAYKLTSRSRLAANAIPLAAPPVTAVFDLAGATEDVVAVRTACGR